jgi:methylmalonyl-CoA decarboxylase
MSGTVHLEERDGVATITIDNQQKRNALGPPLLEQIVETLQSLEEREDVRAVVFTGAGEKAFSAGYDISYYSDDPPTDHERETEEGDLFERMIDLVKYHDYPTIAMINGGVFGGAMHLVAACDLRIAVSDAEFGITPAKLGLVYSDAAIQEVMIHVGPANAKEFLFTGEFVGAERAYDMGFLNRVVERGELEETAYGMAETIAENAPLSLVGMKSIVRALLDHGSLTDAEQEWVEEIMTEAEESRDHAEGVEAFMEGRDPEFEGY